MPTIQTTLKKHLHQKPTISPNAYIAPTAIIIGNVHIGHHTSIWHNAILLADINQITIGNYTNIQDNTIIHVEQNQPTTIGNYVTIGHAAILHACTIHDQTLIGMRATILDHAQIGKHTIIGANSLITTHTKIPPRHIAHGTPAKTTRTLTQQEQTNLRQHAKKYAITAAHSLPKHQPNQKPTT